MIDKKAAEEIERGLKMSAGDLLDQKLEKSEWRAGTPTPRFSMRVDNLYVKEDGTVTRDYHELHTWYSLYDALQVREEMFAKAVTIGVVLEVGIFVKYEANVQTGNPVKTTI